MKKVTSIDEYIESSPDYAQAHLYKLNEILSKEAPSGTGVIKWNVPIYWLNDVIFGFSALKHHISFGPGELAISHFEAELGSFKCGKGTLQLPYDTKLPVSLIRKIAKFCVQLHSEKSESSSVKVSKIKKSDKVKDEKGDDSVKVDEYLRGQKQWAEAMKALRKMLLAAGLQEEFKWGKPCYSYRGGNVAILQGFKDKAALMFFKGALLEEGMSKNTEVKGAKTILEKPGDNSRFAKRFVFAGVEDIQQCKKALTSYIEEAVTLEQQGKKVEVTENKTADSVEELTTFFKQDSELKKAFYALTPGRQRGYLLHFSAAKQAKTRVSRIEKCRNKILSGKGYNEY